MTDAYEELAEQWERTAAEWRDWGMEGRATVLERCAAELRAAGAEHHMEPLTVAEAAEESGYSESHLRNLLSEGKLPNAGEKGRPRIRRKHLPKRPERTDGDTWGLHLVAVGH